MLGLMIVTVIGGAGFLRWDQALIHGSSPVFARTTTDGVQIEVEHGDVRWQHKLCGDGQGECTGRSPGALVRLTLPDGRSGGGFAFPDDLAPTGAETAWCRSGAEAGAPPSVRIVTAAGLGIPPGSIDEQFVVARTTADVARVRAARPDGTIDEMAPVDNIVVLATRTGFDAQPQLQAFDSQNQPVSIC